jgi:hypothetical protein
MVSRTPAYCLGHDGCLRSTIGAHSAAMTLALAALRPGRGKGKRNVKCPGLRMRVQDVTSRPGALR